MAERNRGLEGAAGPSSRPAAHTFINPETVFLYMPEVICAAIAIYCVVMVSFFLTGTPPVWACIFGVIASCISYRCKLK
jgi:hypothetical protein